MFKKLYRKIRNLDQIDSLNREINRLTYLEELKDDKLSNVLKAIHLAANAANKWKHLHRSTTSDQFPNTIKMVMHKIELGVLDHDFDKIHTVVVRNPNSPRGFSYQ